MIISAAQTVCRSEGKSFDCSIRPAPACAAVRSVADMRAAVSVDDMEKSLFLFNFFLLDVDQFARLIFNLFIIDSSPGFC